MLEALAATILQTAGRRATDLVFDAIKRENQELFDQKKESVKLSGDFVATESNVRAALIRHLQELRDWSSSISFVDLRGRKPFAAVYVELEMFLMPVNTHESEGEKEQRTSLIPALVSDTHHAAVLGNPGAGKTTSLQKICADFFNIGKALLNYNFPILIRLRELSGAASAHPIFDRLEMLLGVKIPLQAHGSNAFTEKFDQIRINALTAYLDGLNVLILLDGFDEISTSSVRDGIYSDIEKLTQSLRSSRVIVTSRSAEFRYRAAHIAKFEIAPLARSQIEEFALKWLGREDLARDFLSKVTSSPFADTTIRPLTLAHLCAIYERIKNIPDRPKSVYKRVVQLLIDEWDGQREVGRSSAYAGFDQDRKVEFLAHLAFILTVRTQSSVFGDSQIEDAYKEICGDFGLPPRQARQVALEIESHNGLLIESGYHRFEFGHKSLQEYLTADYLVRLPGVELLSSADVDKLPNELAIAVALSSRPASFLMQIALKLLSRRDVTKEWIGTFLQRLVVEKPDFGPTPTQEETLGALTLVALLSDHGLALKTLLPLFGGRPLAALGGFYTELSRGNEVIHYKRLRDHPQYQLPNYLRLPRALDRDFNMGDRRP